MRLVSILFAMFVAVPAFANPTPPAVRGKVIESLSLITDFELVPGTWGTCEVQNGEYLNTHKCTITGGEFIYGPNAVHVKLETGTQIEGSSSLAWDEYWFRGRLPSGTSFGVSIIVPKGEDAGKPMTGYVQIGAHQKHQLELAQ